MQLPELSPWAGSVGQHCRSFLSLKTGLKSCTSVVLAEDEKDKLAIINAAIVFIVNPIRLS